MLSVPCHDRNVRPKGRKTDSGESGGTYQLTAKLGPITRWQRVALGVRSLKSALVEILNDPFGKKYTSQKAADRRVRQGIAVYDEKHRLVFQEIGRFISQQKQNAEVRLVGNNTGQEWQGIESGKGGPRVMQFAHTRDKGVRAVQKRLGLEPKNNEE